MAKCCARCRHIRNSSKFYKNRTKADGLDDYCKACRRSYFSVYKKTNIAFKETTRRCRRNYYLRHRERLIARSRKWYYTKGNNTRLKRAYGIDQKEYEQMLAKQGGVCAICNESPSNKDRGHKLHIDHDHKTGKVRGLLCSMCNTSIGYLRDDPRLVLAALTYLRGHAVLMP
jgi:Recombination endonuclease VII